MKHLRYIFGFVLFATLFLLQTDISHATVVPESCYSFDSETNTILGYDNDISCVSDPEIPTTINGVDVLAIGNLAFSNKQLTSVTIPDSVTTIGGGAFYNNQLTSVNIPSSITRLENSVFQSNQFASITIPGSVTYIGYGALSSNNLTSVFIPDLVSYIGEYAFYNNYLTSVTFGDSVTNIDNGAFLRNQITSLTIPSSVTSMGGAAFSGNRLSSVIIPSNVTTIEGMVFADNLLTSVTIANGITHIGMQAFRGNQLTSVTIPSSVTSLNKTAFAAQSSIANWYNEVQSGDSARIQSAMDSLHYVRLVMVDEANTNNLVNGLTLESDLSMDANEDGDQADSLGGHILNPSQVTLKYVDSEGNQLISPNIYTGTGLTSYSVSENHTNDLDLYYRVGSSYSIHPPDISGYISPAVVQLALGSEQTEHVFTYVLGNAVSTATDKEGDGQLANTGFDINTPIVMAMALLIMATGIFVSLYRYRYFLE